MADVVQLRNGKRITFQENITVPNRDVLFAQEWGSQVSQFQEFRSKNTDNHGHFYGEFSMRLYCFYQLQEVVSGTFSSLLDLTAGFGCVGKMYEEDLGETFLNDLDPLCVDHLRRNFPPENVSLADAYDYPWARSYDLILADFNNVTLGRTTHEYKPALDGMFAHAGKYVILTESSAFFLQYGEKSYQEYEKVLGTTFPHTHEGFFTAVRDWYRTLYPDWYLTDVEWFKYVTSASYFLFRREDKPLRIRFNNGQDMKANRPVRLNPVGAVLNFPEDFF